MAGAKVTLHSWRRILALGLAAGMAATAIPLQLMAAQETVQESQTTGSVTEGYASERIDNGYTKISAGYTLPEYTGGDIEYPIKDICTSLYRRLWIYISSSDRGAWQHRTGAECCC